MHTKEGKSRGGWEVSGGGVSSKTINWQNVECPLPIGERGRSGIKWPGAPHPLWLVCGEAEKRLARWRHSNGPSRLNLAG